MATGTLKMWNADRGFGFITMTLAGPDIFMHITALRGIDPDNLRLGERLAFDVERDRRPVKARRAGAEGEDQALIARVYSRLLELAKSSKSPEDSGRLMSRSPAAVYKMAIRLGVPLRPVELGLKAKGK